MRSFNVKPFGADCLELNQSGGGPFNVKPYNHRLWADDVKHVYIDSDQGSVPSRTVQPASVHSSRSWCGGLVGFFFFFPGIFQSEFDLPTRPILGPGWTFPDLIFCIAETDQLVNSDLWHG